MRFVREARLRAHKDTEVPHIMPVPLAWPLSSVNRIPSFIYQTGLHAFPLGDVLYSAGLASLILPACRI